MHILIVGVAVFTSHMASKLSMKQNVKPLPVRPNVVITPFVSMRPPAGVNQLTNITNTKLHQAPSNSNPSLPVTVISPSPIIDKTTLKAVSYGAVYKKDSARSFILRNKDSSKVESCAELKGLIKQQLKEDVVCGDFDVGYVQGASVIRVRSRQDIKEMWPEIMKGKIVLWCDGLKGNKTSAPRVKRKLSEFDSEELDDDDDPFFGSAKKKRQPAACKEVEVQEYVDSLKAKHGTTFTHMQLRIWGEMMAAGLHNSTDDHPNTSMFLRAGGKPVQKQNSQSQVSQLLADAATAITSAFTANSPSPSAFTPSNTHLGASPSSSPAKLIESRSKLYKQLSDLHHLHSIEVLTD